MGSVYLSSEDARGVLGVKSAISASRILREHGVINQTLSGVSNSYLSDDVVKVLFARRREALARHGNDPVTYAQKIVRQLRPPGPEMIRLTDGRTVVAMTPTTEQLMARPLNPAYLDPDANM